MTEKTYQARLVAYQTAIDALDNWECHPDDENFKEEMKQAKVLARQLDKKCASFIHAYHTRFKEDPTMPKYEITEELRAHLTEVVVGTARLTGERVDSLARELQALPMIPTSGPTRPDVKDEIARLVPGLGLESRKKLANLVMRHRQDAILALYPVQGTCGWSKDEWDETWSAGCGAEWVFSDGGPVENEMTYCPKCGKKIELPAPPKSQGGD